LVLDSTGLEAVATKSSGGALAALKATQAARHRVVVPAVVLAETLRGGPEDAQVNETLKKVDTLVVDGALAREAAHLKRAAGIQGVAATIDALVVAAADRLGGAAVLTADPVDINRLGEHARNRVRAIRIQ
jgi:predicted nucleic acid-binding protein